MGKLLIVLFALAALNAVLAQRTHTNFGLYNISPRTHGRVQGCGEYPVTYQSLNKPDDDHEPRDVILQRICPTYFILDMSKHSQNLTLIVHTDKNAHPFFKTVGYGEKFLMKNALDPKNDTGVYITLVPEVLNLSEEDSIKYQMFQVQITRRNELPKNAENKTYIEAAIGESLKVIDRQKVQLIPGWTERLQDNQMLEQTIVPVSNSDGHRAQVVTVMKGWLARQLNLSHTEAIHATVQHDFHPEEITIFYQKPDLARLYPGYREITVAKVVCCPRTTERALLIPGWLGELDEISEQTLVYLAPQKPPHPQTVNVTVYPGNHIVKPKNGVLASIDTGSAPELITLYYYSEQGKPEDNPENRAGMFTTLDIIKQFNQTFVDESMAYLSPGWSGILKEESTHQILLPYFKLHTSFSGNVSVSVTLGWQEFVNENDGFTALYSYKATKHPISVHILKTK